MVRRLFARIYPLALCVLIFALGGCGGGTTPTTAPQVLSFTAALSSITAGNSVTLSWSVSNATTLSIDNGVGIVTGTSVSVTPAVTTTYTLTAINGSASTTSKITVTVVALQTPVISSFSASLSAIPAGKSVTLSWSVSNATIISIDNGVGIVTGTSVSVTPAATTTYTLTASNGNTTTTAKVTVVVAAVPPPVISAFNASTTSLTPSTTSSTVTLSWTVTGASTLQITQATGAVQTVSTVAGNSITLSPRATTTYTLTAANSAGGTETAAVTVNVRTNLAVLAGNAYAGISNFAAYQNAAGLGGTSCAYPDQVAIDAQGNLYVTDPTDEMVCKITPGGTVAVLASDGYVSSSSNSAATSATAPSLRGATARAAQNSVTAHTLRTAARDRFSSLSRPAFHTSLDESTANSVTDAGFAYPEGIAVSPDGSTVYVADLNNSVIRRISIAANGSTSISILAGISGWAGYQDGDASQALLNAPEGLALDRNGNLYVADSGNYVIRKIALGSATVSTVAGQGGITGHIDGAGNGNNAVAEFGDLEGLTVSSDGSALYAFDVNTGVSPYSPTIREIAIDSNGNATVSSIAGAAAGYADGVGNSAQFGTWSWLTLGSDGNLYVADSGNSVIRKIALGSATVSTLTGSNVSWGHVDGRGTAAWFWNPAGIAADSQGNLYVSDGNGEGLGGFSYLRKIAVSNAQVSTVLLTNFGNTNGTADGKGSAAAFDLPTAVVGDSSGNYYVADSMNSTIRKIAVASDGTATVTTLAGTAGVYGYADGTGSAAQFDYPDGLAVDPAGNTLYIADAGNGTIRALNLSSGSVVTLAGSAGSNYQIDGIGPAAGFGFPGSMAMGPDGRLYVADQGYVRSVDPSSGQVQTLASISLSDDVVSALAISTDPIRGISTLYLAGQCSVYSLDLANATNSPSLLAGSGSSNKCGYQDSAGTNALFNGLASLSVDSQGNLYATDIENSVVRRITRAGMVTTVAGTWGDATTTLGALPASIFEPIAVGVDATDNLLITTPNAILTLQP